MLHGGPLLISFCVFRIRIVWHDVDAYTSFFMHISPALVSWVLRFHVFDSDNAGNLPSIDEWEAWIAGLPSGGWIKILGFAMLYYFTWNICYYFLIFKVLDKRIERRKYMTLYKYFKQTSAMYKMIDGGSDKVNQLRYCLSHATFSMFGLCYGTVMLYYRYVTFGVMFFFMIWPIWFASTYYHEYFSNRYTGNMEKQITKTRERRLASEGAKSKEE